MMPRPGGRSPWTLPSQSLMWTWMALPLSFTSSIGLVSASTRWLTSILARTREWLHSSTKRAMALTLLSKLSRKGSSSSAISIFFRGNGHRFGEDINAIEADAGDVPETGCSVYAGLAERAVDDAEFHRG